ncbi:TRAP transporter small permease [Calidifontibacillus erzurumensis]|nr:TRAP transporter small permease [Calidifontibacillus erzurumensis]
MKKIFTLFEDFFSSLFFLVGLGLMFYEVIMRYVFNDPTTWINETASILVVWGILFGLSVALRDHHHISVDIFYAMLPRRIKKAVDIFANLVGIGFCLFLVFAGIELVSHSFQSGQVTMDTRIPYWIYYLIMPISGLLFLVRFIERLIKVIKNQNVEGGHLDGNHTAF